MLITANLLVEVKDTAIEDLDSPRFKELFMILTHEFFTFFCELGGNLYENVLAFTVDIQIIVFEKI